MGMGISIIKPGMLTTVQDRGRYGFQKSGMVVSGAMDTLAFQLGNMVLGNPENAAALECTIIGPTIRFDKGQRIAITGGDLSPNMDGEPIPMWKPIYVPTGSILSFGQPRSGCRSYICFFGGLDIPVVLQSRSTYLRGKMGGWHGRALEKGDRIPFCTSTEGHHKTATWQISTNCYTDLRSNTVRVIKGPHLGSFKNESIVDFFSTPFSISNESDRMGYRLMGAALRQKQPTELLSAAVTFGTIQVPSQGHPIVLMADRPTTGGYPIIAQVASIDLPLLAQLKPQEQINFEIVTLAEAQQLLENRYRQINQLRQSIALQYEQST